VSIGKQKLRKADYFPMVARNGKRFNILFTRHGHKGPLTWFVLLQQLTSTDDHHIKIRYEDDVDLVMLADECRVNEKEFIEIVETMVRLMIVDKQLWEQHRVIFINELVLSLEKIYKKRQLDPPTKESLLKRYNTTTKTKKKVS
jgi:hypothetical protein